MYGYQGGKKVWNELGYWNSHTRARAHTHTHTHPSLAQEPLADLLFRTLILYEQKRGQIHNSFPRYFSGSPPIGSPWLTLVHLSSSQLLSQARLLMELALGGRASLSPSAFSYLCL